MLRDVVVILGTEVHPFELGTLCEVFGLDRSEDGLPGFEFAVCAPDPTPRVSAGGLTVTPSHGLDRADSADLLAIPAWAPDREPLQPDVVEVLHAALERGATVLSVCSGAFLLAAAGLLDGRRATCHWHHVDQMRQRYPHVSVEPDRLYVDEGQVVTSAGTAAGIDACLHLVRRELGAEVANGIARRMVVPPHRDGGQAQYVTAPVPTCERNGHDIASLMDWLRAHLDQAHTVAGLAARLHLSTRTFARRFTETTGTTPHCGSPSNASCSRATSSSSTNSTWPPSPAAAGSAPTRRYATTSPATSAPPPPPTDRPSATTSNPPPTPTPPPPPTHPDDDRVAARGRPALGRPRRREQSHELSAVVVGGLSDAAANGWANYAIDSVPSVTPGRVGPAVITMVALDPYIAAPRLSHAASPLPHHR